LVRVFYWPKDEAYVFVDHRSVGGFKIFGGSKILRALDRWGDFDRLVWGEV
jgi:hypothetical protein